MTLLGLGLVSPLSRSLTLGAVPSITTKLTANSLPSETICILGEWFASDLNVDVDFTHGE